MIRRKIQDLTLCITYNVNFLHDKAHGSKNFRKQYSISEEIGRGGFGIVYKAERNEDGAPVAVKFVEHRHTCKQLVPTEICLLEMCRGTPGVVRLIDWFANSKGFMIVMERPDEFMDLFDLISIYGGLDEKIARSIFVQIVNTVCSLYADHGVLHRDIKDENIIINMRTGEVILVDFGAATLISKTDAKEFQGTRSYCPPEWFKRVVYMPLEATVWSLGIVLYVIVTGSLPFRNEIQICLGRLTIPKKISQDCEHLIRRCLAVTPERRADLVEVREHRWLCQPITIHSEPFKCVLDRKLTKRLSGRRNIKRCSSSGAISSDDTELLSDSQTDASIDMCERIRRASSANVTVGIDNEMTPVVQRRVFERVRAENDAQLRCFSNYDNLHTPTEMLQLTDYEGIFEEGISSRRIDVDADELSRDMSMSQYYSAHESLGFCADDSHPSQVDSSLTEDDSRYFDTDSLRDAIALDLNNVATTSTFVHQNPMESASVAANKDISESHDDSVLGSRKSSSDKQIKHKISRSTERAPVDRGVSPSLSRHRPLTVQRSDLENSNLSNSLGIFRIDSRKYINHSNNSIDLNCSAIEDRSARSP
uniref:Serine/threonine-protein kinase 1 n=1 Tax=Ascaris lumbricoides TaxID=6252 RepID=A0A9J2PZI1_ASCLU